MKRTKKLYPEDLRSQVGFFTLSWVHAFSTMVFSLFMQFLTDYSGIDAALGKVGFAAAFGTAILLITRIVDAVDDPLQAWIMDRSKENKFGKYRRFTLVSVILTGIGIVIMFTLPEAVKSNAVLLVIWVMVGYVLYEMGYAFNGIYSIIQKATTNARIRTKLSALMRMGTIVAIIPSVFFIPIATAVNASVGDMGKSFSLTCVGITVVSCIISLIGVLLTKEPYHGKTSSEKVAEPKLSIKDVWEMFKSNKPMWIHNIAYFLSNLAYSASSAVLVYFLKWFYCADMGTGVVDELEYAAIYGIYGIISLLPNFITPLMAGFVVKKLGSVDKAMRVCTLLGGLIFGSMFIFYLLGILQLSPMVFIILNLLAGIPMSIAVIPAMLLNNECADYVEYTTGKNMAAMTTAVNNLVQKTQTALATLIPGIILMAVGYSVDSVTGAYAGDLTKLPGMVTGLTVAMTLIPLVVSVAAWAVYKFAYPITPEFREKMTAELERRRAEAQEVQ